MWDLVMGVIPGITGTGGRWQLRHPSPAALGAGCWEQLLGVHRHPDRRKTSKCGFEAFSIGWTVYTPDDRDGALGYLLFDRHLVQTCQQFRKLLVYKYGEDWVALGFFNHYYYYLIVHILWYWAGQLGSGADPLRPWAGARPVLATASSCKASPLGTSPPGRRATVGILLADGGFPGDIYIYI